MAMAMLARIAAGEDPAAERAHARAMRAVPTLREALEAYLAAAPRPQSGKAALYRTSVHRHLGAWLERPLDTITHEDIEHCFARLSAEAGWMPANDAVRVLGALYRQQCAGIEILHDPVEQWRGCGRAVPPPALSPHSATGAGAAALEQGDRGRGAQPHRARRLPLRPLHRPRP